VVDDEYERTVTVGKHLADSGGFRGIAVVAGTAVTHRLPPSALPSRKLSTSSVSRRQTARHGHGRTPI
jgi:hypothetical protein